MVLIALASIAWTTSGLAAQSAPAPSVVPATGTVLGQVRDQSTRLPLPDATVEILHSDWSGRTATGASGDYRIANVPAGRSLLRVSHIGHATLELEVLVAAGREVAVDVALSLEPVALAPVTVKGSPDGAPDDSIATANAELGLARTRALESTPGMAELGMADAAAANPGQDPADPGSVLYVRGAGADLKLVYLDGAPIYAPFPLGGFLDPFAPGLLRSAQVYLGGAPARYDGGLSYVMDLRTREATTSGVRTSGSADLFSARVLAEAGIGDRVGVIASARGMHHLASSAIFGEDLPYAYGERIVRGDARLGNSTLVSVTGFSNSESVRIGSAATPDSLVRWGNLAGSARVRTNVGGLATTLTAAIGNYDARLPLSRSPGAVTRGEATTSRFSADFSRRASDVLLGFGASFARQHHLATANSALGTASPWRLEAAGQVSGVYAEAAGQLGSRVYLRGGFRLDHFAGGPPIEFAPRVTATWFPTERASLTLAAGQYHQFVRAPAQLLARSPEEVQSLSSPRLAVGSASHFTASLDQELGEGVLLGIEGYYKSFSDVAEDSGVGANASGVDFWIRRAVGDVTGWIGYSLAWVWSGSEVTDRRDFTGRHLLSAGLRAPLREGTNLDLRFAYGAGLPYSAIPLEAGAPTILNQRNTVTAATVIDAFEGTESAPLLRLPDEPFLRLDASLSQLWTARRGNHLMRFSPYIRVLNNFGSRDALFYLFDPADDQPPRAIDSLPIVPVIGFEWGF